MNDSAIPRLNTHFRLQWEQAQDCYVLLYPEGMIKLNASAGMILSHIDGVRSVAELIADLEAQFPDVPSVADDTRVFLSTAQEQRWINVD